MACKQYESGHQCPFVEARWVEDLSEGSFLCINSSVEELLGIPDWYDEYRNSSEVVIIDPMDDWWQVAA